MVQLRQIAKPNRGRIPEYPYRREWEGKKTQQTNKVKASGCEEFHWLSFELCKQPQKVKEGPRAFTCYIYSGTK